MPVDEGAGHARSPGADDSRYFLARVPSGSPVTFDGHEPLEAATTVGYRWFRHDEILAREHAETFLPLGLGELLGHVLAGRTRPEPIRLP